MLTVNTSPTLIVIVAWLDELIVPVKVRVPLSVPAQVSPR